MLGAQRVGAPGSLRGGVLVERKQGRCLEVAGQGRLVVPGRFLDPPVEVKGPGECRSVGGRRQGDLVRTQQDGPEERVGLFEAPGLDGQTRPAEAGQSRGVRVGLGQFVIGRSSSFFVAGSQFGIAEKGCRLLGPRGGQTGKIVVDCLQVARCSRGVTGGQATDRRIEFGWRIHADFADVGERNAGAASSADLQSEITAAHPRYFAFAGEPAFQDHGILRGGRKTDAQRSGSGDEAEECGKGACIHQADQLSHPCAVFQHNHPMFTTIRKHQRWLMTLVAALTIIAFAWLYNTTDLERVGSNIVAQIYGRDVMQVDIEKAVRNYQLALALGQFELVRELSGQAQTEDEAANNFIWNLMVLQHESARLGVEPGDQSVVDRIKTLPVFQTGGQFDPLKYSNFLQDQLAPRGFSERQLESVIRDSLRLAAVRALVTSPAVVLPGEVSFAVERIRPLDLEVLRWDAASAGKNVDVSDEELRSVFAQRAAQLLVPEKRSVRYALFVLDRKQRELEGKERVEALQKLSTATGDFARVLSEGGQDMASAAAGIGAEVRTTPLFGSDGSTSGALAGDDGEIVPAAAAVAFRLPLGAGNYEIVQVGQDGYAVIEVAAVEAGRPMTFEEAQADLRAELIAQKRDAALRQAAEEDISAIRSALAEGQTFAQAAKAAGIKPETMSGLSPLDRDLDATQRGIAVSAVDLPAGTLGDFNPVPPGGFAVYVAARGQTDEATAAEQLPTIENGILEGKEMLLFAQWLVTARQESGLQVLRPLM